jgi:hypothetical protein
MFKFHAALMRFLLLLGVSGWLFEKLYYLSGGGVLIAIRKHQLRR